MFGSPPFRRAKAALASCYFALRDLGAAVGFGVDYDEAARAMLVSTK